MIQQHNSLEDSIAQAITAGEYQQAACLINRQAEIWMRNGELTSIMLALQSLPRMLVERHLGLCMWSGWVQTLTGEQEQAEYWVDQAELVLKGRFPTPEHYHGLILNEYRNAAGQILAIRGLLALRSEERATALQACEQALALLPLSNPALRTITSTIHTVAGLDLVTAATAIVDLQQLRRAAFATEQPFVLASILMHEAACLLGNGQLQSAFQISKRMLAHMKDERNPLLAGLPHIRLGQLAYLWNELADAEQHLETGLTSPHSQFALVVIDGYITLARVQAANGQHDLGYATLRIAEQFARSSGRHSVCERIAAWDARLHLMNGDTSAAVRWAKQAGCWNLTPDVSENQVLAGVDQVLTFCRLLIVLADAESNQRAEVLLQAILKYAIEKQRVLVRIEAGVVLAWLYAARGKTRRAVSILAETLALAETSGAIRLLIDDGPWIMAPLGRLMRTGPLYSVVMQVQHAIQASMQQTNQIIPQNMLSKHELEILRLLAEGHSNAEIARRQSLALSTVQWYLKQIYRKLDVHNRTQAALCARDLNLLSSAFPPLWG